MNNLAHIALVVADYDESIRFFVDKLDFVVIEDIPQPKEKKRWVTIAPPNSIGCTILLSRARDEDQKRFIGNQSGGRVFLFLSTDDFDRDYNKLLKRGVEFVRPPKTQDYGTVAVFKDLYGNLWDLIQLNSDHIFNKRISA